MKEITLSPEPGKRILPETVRIGTPVPCEETGEYNVTVYYDTENILKGGEWAHITTSAGETSWGLVENPFFHGAYDIPSFSITAQVHPDGTVETRTKSVRFRNVTVRTVDDEAELEHINELLHKEGLHWYEVLGKIRKQVPRSDTYFMISRGADGLAHVMEVKDAHTEEDDTRYLRTGNYYVTAAAAERVAQEYNSIFI